MTRTDKTKAAAGTFTDIPDAGWIARRAPGRLRPYLRLARLDRPIGTWLLLWPCWWSLAMAAPRGNRDWGDWADWGNWPDPWLLAAFALGALVMRGAGCAWNDITDRDFDGQVERTRSRPIPSGELSLGQAAAFMALLALIGLNILARLNPFAMLLGVMSLAPVLLYLGGIAWTLGYDTIYAHQDKVDDALIGIKSSARALGAKTRPMLWLFYGSAITLFGLAGWWAELGPLFLIGLVLAAVQLAWQAGRVNIDDPGDCLAKFRSNTWFGWIVFAAAIIG